MGSPSEITQADAAYERLRADILSCRLRPGAKLLINELAKELDVSVGAVREALSRLSAEDMTVSTAQKGFRVAGVSAEDLVDLTATRVHIEGICLRRSIANGTVEWETEIVGSLHRLQRLPEREPSDPSRLSETWADAHLRFHEALVSACDLKWMLRLRAMLYAQSERYRRLSVPLRKTDRDVAAEHKAIFEAVMDRDADLAVVLMRRHFELTTDIVLNSIAFEKDNEGVEAAEPARRGPGRRRLATAG